MEERSMTRTGFISGIAIGMAAGAAVGMMVKPKKKHCGKKTAAKALKAAGELVDNISGYMWF